MMATKTNVFGLATLIPLKSLQIRRGSLMQNMVNLPRQGYKQMDAVNRPGLILMQAGGNDVGFYNVAIPCLALLYPDPAGRCKQAIDMVRDFIHREGNPFTRALGYDMMRTIDDVLNHPSHSGDPEFRLYVLGYGHFFNMNEESTWCNNWSSVEISTPSSKRQTAKSKNRCLDSTTLKFNILISPRLLIAVAFASQVTMLGTSIILNLNGEFRVRTEEPTQKEFDRWIATGRFTEDANEISFEDVHANWEIP
ncbi:hypothetical protein CC78DRAFT_576683 [Lojkania enalia]|uniref:SGNH hydrolase-type esterase domain-containing protein n=1 Tax=Lojkania enalia TaxID=147567 RepID=A0A9P4KGF9_9PLEO|nr:hypothetical protein CC78DRAFT_576683 [Didymosphaeria enalia]